MVIDVTSYKAMSRLSPHINAGASARLNLQPMASGLTGEADEAFCYGWRTTDASENRAGRVMPSGACTECGGGPVYCRNCMAAISMVGG